MSRRSRVHRFVAAFLAALGIAAFAGSLAVTLTARQNSKPPAGARIFVVAVRDSRLLTLCPVAGKEVSFVGSPVFSAATPGEKATVRPIAPLGMQEIRLTSPAWLRTSGASRGWALLPPPAAAAGRAPDLPPAFQTVVALPTEAPSELDRLALDADVRARVQREFRKTNRYTVVDAIDRAEFVFVVETSYLSMAAWTSVGDGARNSAVPKIDVLSDGTRVLHEDSTAQTGGGIAAASYGGDRALNWRQAALAVVVPADAYRRFPSDGGGLTSNRIWEGFSLGETIRTERGLDMREGRAELLAAEFAGKWREPIAALPVCAASAGPLRITSTAIAARLGGPDGVVERGAGAAASARSQGAVFRAGVTVVRVPFTVADDNGRAIIDISPSELHLFEDGIEQRIDTILPASASTSLALLMDMSDSMRQYRQDLRLASLTLSDMLRPADRLLVASFDSRVRVLAEFTRDAAILTRAAMADPRPGLGTRLYDAIDLVTEDRLREVDGRAAMVVVTDGIDTYSRIVDAAGTRDAIDDANLAVYVVRYDTSATLGRPPFQIRLSPQPAPKDRPPVDASKPDRRSPSLVPQGGRWLVLPDDVVSGAEIQNAADQFLSRLSTTSGGRLYYAPAGTDLREVFASIVEELSRQLTICYYPANAKADGTYRQINVTIDRPGHVVRSRKGYRAGGR
jgi:VWFA-related protein